MTREEFRDYVEFLRSQNEISYDVYSGLIDGIDTLEQETSEDAINREFLLRDLLLKAQGEKDVSIKWLEEYINSLPPVKSQEPRKGHWIYDYTSADGHRVYHCSECGCYLKPKTSEYLSDYKWCSLCGADMRGDK